MAITSKELGNKLWGIANKQRGTLSASDYKDYILGFIFYKHISEKMETMANKALENDGISYIELTENDSELLEAVKKESLKSIGYYLAPWELYNELIRLNEDFILDKLKDTFRNIENSTLGQSSEEDFQGLFEEMNLTSNKLGETVEQKNSLIVNTMKELSDVELLDSEDDILGDAYEFLIGKFAANSGKSGGEFYTPQPVSKLVSMIVTHGKEKINKVYDPTCGSGSLLLRVAKELEYTPEFYGQELNGQTYDLSRMNMIMHDVYYNKFNIKRGDTLENPKHINLKFDAIVANPPYSIEWSASSILAEDDRFSSYGKMAPKKKADFAFVQHMLYHLEDNGTMAVVLPLGVLFREGAEKVIRQHIIEDKNYLDAVIELPADMFFGTNIPTCILVFKKCRTDDKVLFINASKEFDDSDTKNVMKQEHINKVFKAYTDRKDIDKFVYNAPLSEIKDNDFNINVSRYINIFEQEADIDLSQVVDSLSDLDKEINENDTIINNFCIELGIDSPIISKD